MMRQVRQEHACYISVRNIGICTHVRESFTSKGPASCHEDGIWVDTLHLLHHSSAKSLRVSLVQEVPSSAMLNSGELTCSPGRSILQSGQLRQQEHPNGAWQGQVTSGLMCKGNNYRLDMSSCQAEGNTKEPTWTALQVPVPATASCIQPSQSFFQKGVTAHRMSPV